MLKAVNKHFGLNIDEKSLKDTALELGSDCPFFIGCTPSFASGRGETLQPISPVLTGYYILLLNPGVEINTKEAYENCRPVFPSTSLLQLIDHPITKWKELIVNDFEDYAFKKFPLIGKIKDELYRSGALFSSMSGSGSSVYGIFPEKSSVPDTLKDFLIYEGIM
jgi:4-diphosphocytidyl-2-C-methyl-D-erythritol kinase